MHSHFMTVTIHTHARTNARTHARTYTHTHTRIYARTYILTQTHWYACTYNTNIIPLYLSSLVDVDEATSQVVRVTIANEREILEEDTDVRDCRGLSLDQRLTIVLVVALLGKKHEKRFSSMPDV